MIATNPEIGKRLCVDKITSVQHPTLAVRGRRVRDLPGTRTHRVPKLILLSELLLPYNPQWSSYILAILYSEAMMLSTIFIIRRLASLRPELFLGLGTVLLY
jgi:hypothetical protein